MRYDTGLRLRLLLGSALFSAIASPVFAKDAPAAPEAAATPAAEGQISDVVVTATKRETNLQKTPIAISVLDSATISDRHVQSLMDLADGGVPSLRIATFEARQSALTVGIRGIVPFDQNQTARDSGVGVYVDGVYLGRSQGLNAALFDVARLEVLRGPQGTLFGRNTEGGALSIVTKAPTGEFGGRMSAGVGNFGSYDGQLHLNLPSFANIAIKADAMIQHQDPTVKNPLAGQIGWNAYNRVGGRIAARWTPFDGFTADFAFDKAKDENTPFYSQLINYNPKGLNVGTYTAPGGALGTSLFYGGVACNTSNGAGGVNNPCIAPKAPLVGVHPERQSVADVGVPQQYSVDETQGFSANLKYHISSAIELRSITAWRKVSTNQWDNSGGPERVQFVPNGKTSRYSLSDLYQSQFSQELQLVGSIPQFDYVAGLYYFYEQARESAATPTSIQWNADGTAYTILPSQVFGAISSGNQGWDYNSRFLQRASFARARSYAAFGQVTYSPDFADTLHLTVGGRYTKDKRNGALYMVSGAATPWVLNYDRSRFDPMVTLAWDASQGINLYAKYSTGFRAGGANDRSSTFGAFGPEAVKAYEIGAKLDMLDRKVRLNLAGYIMDRSGTQIDFDNVDTTQFLANGTPNPTYNLHTENTANAPGISKIRGFEADLTVRPVDRLTLGASYAYTYTNVPTTLNPNPGPTFNAPTAVFVVYTPRNAASGYVDYEIPVGGNDTSLRFHLDANYADAAYSFQSESVKADSSFIVNGRLALADIAVTDHNKVTLSVWSRNLLNESHIYRRSAANAAVLGDYANFNTPRTFGAEISAKF
ncbi:TonB-dependent receptor [Sphingomonas sp. AR_OL41]|uniref:TonB-dependent receptor n=1 Tax=Sphingomonas sp. AR_OL41 TaxID=3042729 RepID=UPI00247FDCA0|nr:TonB-dependent receptor [Sphingomonas sp. AR_OL41]MDH7972286.1 TonB-dependent receptor [Sphingomonas sp. AR_OL41]